MMEHAERTHAVLSASGAHRWMACPGSALLEQQFPDTGSEAAEEGTLAHELAELKVRNHFFTPEFTKRKMNSAIGKLKKHKLWKDEMIHYTDDYLDYIKATALAFPSKPYVAIEKRVDFGSYVPGGFGTADCTLIGRGVIWVTDFKYGKGVPVSAEGNPQLQLYALGAYEAYRFLYDIHRIKLSIVQPRLDNISEWECPLEDLLKFGAHAKSQADLALSGTGEFHPDEETFRFCRARAQCRARAEKNVKLAFFTDKKPPLISNEDVGEYLSQGEDVARWLADLKEYALRECLAGREIPGWKAVEGHGSRGWTDADKALETLKSKGFDEAVLYKREPYTLAQLEKTIGKKEFSDAVGEYIVKNPGSPALAKASDKREAITNKVSTVEAFREEPVHEQL